ncbi:VOC family protein [Parerythrobacter aestuarii]|uniref:VOC family protein n=1 Tax=Parerythrobacter aestuarii TaxID=3020909 RepID=UPI0024DEAEAE|nr:VOC family protein [Parerythrobacter aestuarii]
MTGVLAALLALAATPALAHPEHDEPAAAPAMEPRLSFVTLGVADMERAIAFYRDGLGLPMEGEGEADGIAMFKLGSTRLALYPRGELAADATVPDAPNGNFSGITLSHNVASKEAVDTLLAKATSLGAKLLKPGQDAFWGGYSGYFADPDGHLWEVAWNPFLPLDDPAGLPPRGPGSNTALTAPITVGGPLSVIISDVVIPAGGQVPRHCHPGQEFLYMVEGSATHVEHGKPDRQLGPGDAYVIPAGAIHSPIGGPEGGRAVVFRVHVEGQPERVAVPEGDDNSACLVAGGDHGE